MTSGPFAHFDFLEVGVTGYRREPQLLQVQGLHLELAAKFLSFFFGFSEFPDYLRSRCLCGVSDVTCVCGSEGREDKDKLNLDPSLLDDDLYRLDLVEKGNQFPEIMIDLALEPRTYILDPLLSDG